MDRTRHHFDGAVVAVKARDKLVVIPRDIDHTRPLATGAQDFLDHVIVRLRPIDPATQRPHIDQVSDHIKGFEFVSAEEMQQGFSFTPAGAQVDIRDPAGAVSLHGSD